MPNVVYEMSLRDNLSRVVDSANASVNRFERSLGSAQNTAMRLGAALGITAGIAGAAMFAKSMVEAGSKVEDARVGLTTLLGEAKEAGTVINSTMEDALKTPFDFQVLLQANKAIISAGVESKTARTDVLNLANAIAATGGGNDELQRMVVNMQQIKNVGKASAMDIKQFAYAGINLYKVLEDAGIKVEKGNEDQAISYDMISKALAQAHGIGGIYYNGLENMAGNTSVRVSNLSDALFQLKVKMFDDLKPAIDSIISATSKFIANLRDGWNWMVKNKDVIVPLTKGIIAAVAAFKLMTIIPVILLAVENALVAAAASGISFGAAMAAALGPITLIAAAVGGLVYLFSSLGTAMDDARKARNEFLGQSDEKELTYLQELAESKGGGQKGIDAAAVQEKAALRAQLTDLQTRIKTATGDQAKDINDQITETLVKMQTVDKFQQGLVKTGQKLGGTKAASTAPASTKAASSKAQGTKAVTINVSIKELIHEQKISTTTIKESATKIKDLVTEALTGAINDFQITAGL